MLEISVFTHTLKPHERRLPCIYFLMLLNFPLKGIIILSMECALLVQPAGSFLWVNQAVVWVSRVCPSFQSLAQLNCLQNVMFHPQVHAQCCLYFFCISVDWSFVILNAVLIRICCQSLNQIFWHKLLEVLQWCVEGGDIICRVCPEKSVTSVMWHDVFLWLPGLNIHISWTIGRFLVFFVHRDINISFFITSSASVSSKSMSTSLSPFWMMAITLCTLYRGFLLAGGILKWKRSNWNKCTLYIKIAHMPHYDVFTLWTEAAYSHISLVTLYLMAHL